jgi:hypothetical protein
MINLVVRTDRVLTSRIENFRTFWTDLQILTIPLLIVMIL